MPNNKDDPWFGVEDTAYHLRKQREFMKETAERIKKREEVYEGRSIVIPVHWRRHSFLVRFTVELPLCKEPCCSEEIEEGRKKTIEYVLERLEG